MTKERWQRMFAFILLVSCVFFFAGSIALAEQIQVITIQATPEAEVSQPAGVPAETSDNLSDSQAVPDEISDKQKETTSPIQMDNSTGMKLSLIEQYVSGKISSKVSTDIKQFGYSLFNKPSSAFAPVKNIPVGPNYVVGPGDEIRIAIWGKVEGTWNIVVDRDGKIALPKVGSIGVTGLSFKELKLLLHSEFSQYYSGFEINVSLGTLRTIQVYVVGNAKKPGAYTISSISTLVNALFDTGGPAKNGTMRDIQVKRDGRTIVHFDMYDFLLNGDKSKDIRLMPQDVIFIPPIKAIAAITGRVKTPAIYELSKETKISEIIKMAGGVTASGYLQRIQLERIHENEVKIILDSNLKELNEISDIVLHDGDIIRIFPISTGIVNAITLAGNVARPGKYQWFEGIRVSDIIKNSEKDLLSETFMDHALITRLMPPDFHKELISIDLAKALFEKDPDHDKVLTPYDNLTVYSKWNFLNVPKVRISGAVNKPGQFIFRTNMLLSDLIKIAGGPKRYAFLKIAELTRVTITDEGPVTERVLINLKKVLAGDLESDFKLKEDDYLFIRTIPDWRLYRTVTITGEVKFAGVYTVKKNETLSSLINRAGGFTDDAYLAGALFTRGSIRVHQQAMLNKMVNRLERELFSEGTVVSATAYTAEEAKIRITELDQKRRFVASLRRAKAKGRLVISLSPPDRLQGTADDILLEEGDTLHIPENPMTVTTIGSLYNQSTFVYKDGQTVSDYIKMSGGFTRNADKKRLYLFKANGIAVKPGKGFKLSWNSDENRWDSGNQVLESGDTIVAPEKLERVAWLRHITSITQIIYQMAVTAGILITAF